MTESNAIPYGRTDLMVSPVCQGTAFRNMARSPDNELGLKVLRHCLGVGLNFFDTAPGYGAGGSELLLGKALDGQRDRAVIANRVINIGVPPGSVEGELLAPSKYTREYIFRSTEWSLKRLRTDYLDILSIHKKDGAQEHHDPKTVQSHRRLYENPDPTPFAEICETMDALVRSGKVRYWGLSQYNDAEVNQFLQLAEAGGTRPISSLQNAYSLLKRDSPTERLFPVIRASGLGVQTIGPHAAGLLTSGYVAEPESPLATLHAVVDRVAGELGVPRSHVCVAWVLAHPELTTALAGAESEQQVDDNMAGARLQLPAEALDLLDQASLDYSRTG